MIVKSTVYFEIKKQTEAENIDTQLIIDYLNNQLEEYLTDSSFKLKGSTWTGTKISAEFVTRSEALERLRIKK